MKQDLRSYALVKAAALLLAVACGVGAVFSWFYCAAHWDSLFDGGDPSYSPAWNRALAYKENTLNRIVNLYDVQRRGGALGYLDQQRYQEAQDSLDPSVTNFRYVVRDNDTGEVILSSAGEHSLVNVPADSLRRTLRTTYGQEFDYSDISYDADRDTTYFFDGENTIVYEIAGDVTGDYPPQRSEAINYAIEYGVDATFPIHDSFYDARNAFDQGDIRALYLACALSAAFLIGTVFLLCCAGRRPKAETFLLNWTDKIPYDLYLFLMICAAAGCFALAVELMAEGYLYHLDDPSLYAMWGASGGSWAAGFALTEAALMSTATRCKTHTLLKNTVVWRVLCALGRLCKGLGRWFGTVFGSWKLTHRVVVLFLLYLLGSVLTGFTIILILPYQAAVLYGLCRWCMGWAAIRQGTAAIVGGAPETVIPIADLSGPVCRELRTHAEQLNDLGSAISSAVDERLKSERMKAELITNVSHDLKTPLTSIINYVDLLKKTDIQDKTAKEYIEVLDRKSQRLKKLTEDLVEASKASTGTLPVNAERIGVVQLVKQALGEYEEKLTGASLTPVVTLPQEEVYVWADGRHLWRVLDNLMGNCVKYAMAGTRVYLDVVAWDGRVTISVKNVSAQQLNVPVESLLERFVRGDESRTTEGSGLGLSIAQSLTELGGGAFRLDVDGDLFKAVVSLPQVK